MQQTEELTKYLRLIADYGFIWEVGNPSPNITQNDRGLFQVNPAVIAKMVEDRLLDVELQNVITAKPRLHYQLTAVGVEAFLKTFSSLRPPEIVEVKEHA